MCASIIYPEFNPREWHDGACRGIDINGSIAAAWKDMTAAGVKKIESSDIA